MTGYREADDPVFIDLKARFLGKRVQRDGSRGRYEKRSQETDTGTVNMVRATNRRYFGREGGQVHIVWDVGRCSWIAPDRVKIVEEDL